MKTKPQTKKAQETALEAYMTELFAADEAAARISQYLEDHGETTPDDIHWGHVGSMAHIRQTLEQLRDMIDGTGEFAE